MSCVKQRKLPDGALLDVDRLKARPASVARLFGPRCAPEDRPVALDAVSRAPIDKMAALDAVDETPDGLLTQPVPFLPTPYALKFQRGPFSRVFRRAQALLERLSLVRQAQARGGFSASSMEKTAHLIAEFYVWKHTPRLERDPDWPASKAAFCQGYALDVWQLEHALTLVRFPKWEARYMEYTDPVIRAAIYKDVLLAGAVRQLDADAGKENANWLRTALQADGEIKGTQKVTQVNIGSNVLNMPEGMSSEMLQARIDTMNRLAQRMNAREVPYVQESQGEGAGGSTQEPQGVRQGEARRPSGEAQADSGGTGEA